MHSKAWKHRWRRPKCLTRRMSNNYKPSRIPSQTTRVETIRPYQSCLSSLCLMDLVRPMLANKEDTFWRRSRQKPMLETCSMIHTRRMTIPALRESTRQETFRRKMASAWLVANGMKWVDTVTVASECICLGASEKNIFPPCWHHGHCILRAGVSHPVARYAFCYGWMMSLASSKPL